VCDECGEEALMESRHKFKFYYCSYYCRAHRDRYSPFPPSFSFCPHSHVLSCVQTTKLIWQYEASLYTNKRHTTVCTYSQRYTLWERKREREKGKGTVVAKLAK